MENHAHCLTKDDNEAMEVDCCENNIPDELKQNVPNSFSTFREKFITESIVRLKPIKSEHEECLTELFFLQNGGNLMDYYSWKKRPNNLLTCFLESEKLNGEDFSKEDYLVSQKVNEDTNQINEEFYGTLNMSCSEVSFCGRMEEAMDESTIESQETCTSFQENGFIIGTNSPTEPSQTSVQESIAELARQEAQVMKKITELRKHGLWSMRRMPKSYEPPRQKTHWDYVLEEMQWLSNDFAQERKTKRSASKKISRFIGKYFQDLQQRDLKAEKEDTLKLKKIASNISKIVKEFWSNIEKVIQYKQQSRVDEKRKKALDLHLNFIVVQTEKYSTWLTEGLVTSSNSNPAVDAGKQKTQSSSTTEEPQKEEGTKNSSCTNKLLSCQPPGDSDADSYVPSDDDLDDEETIVEQENNEEKINYDEELSCLQKEGDMPIEELYALYYNNNNPDPPSASESPKSPKVEKKEIETEPGETKNKKTNLEVNISDITKTALSFQPTGNTLETTHVKTPVPFLLKHQLREYQHVGLDWLATMYEQRLNGILADEMGLGKTIQTIALLGFLAIEKGIWGPHLIVVPTSVMLNWEMELKKWCPGLKILTYYGSLKERKAKRQGWSKTNAFHVCITSYKLVIQDHQSFRRKKWKYFILDEAHNIKNFKSQRWQTLLNFHSQRRLLLTGTPLQNNLMELWSLMHFLMPHVFQSHSEFKEWFSNPLTGMIEGSKEYNESIVKRLHKVLRPFLLRRLKQDVEKQMPKKYEHVVMCRLSKHQRYLYEDFMSQTKTKETLATGHFMSVINILMQLRKVCNHPNLFDPRPTVSPFHMGSLVCNFPRVIIDDLSCVNIHPTKIETIRDVAPAFVDMELDMTRRDSSVIRELRTTRKSIFSQFPDVFYPNSMNLVTNEKIKTRKLVQELTSHQEGFWLKLEKKRFVENQTKLEKIWKKNEWKCSHEPVYGVDLRRAVTIDDLQDFSNLSWNAQGHIHCSNAQGHIHCSNSPKEGCDWYWKQTSCLSDLVCTFDKRLQKLADVISRFVFVIPPATAPTISMHPIPRTRLNSEMTLKHHLSKELNPVFSKLHNISIKQTVQFPDLRLIQYDCGKLQALDVLLRQLKQGSHRVLIFTQMTKMLDVLEQFLNFHGHRYLRLDGTTKVEQRQVLMERFNMDKKIFCFILSTRSGGIGVNLTGADTVIFYDSDWNPTMDAQAQDRCHRIGQTRDVHIYRLVSEKTIEENILKKANEKRLLGNVAIEGGNFTTAFFKQHTIRDLFEEPSGIECVVTSEENNKKEVAPETAPELTEDQIEQALCAAEDETDIQAAKTAKAEQKEELAEFDESLPWDDCKYNEMSDNKPKEDVSNVEVELALLEKNLTPIERYAVCFMEVQLAPVTIEELSKAEEEVGIAREEWELNHLKAIKEEEERKAEMEEDEMLYVSAEKKFKPKKPKLPYLEMKKMRFLDKSEKETKKKEVHISEGRRWNKSASGSKKKLKMQKPVKKKKDADYEEEEETTRTSSKRIRYEDFEDQTDTPVPKKKPRLSFEYRDIGEHFKLPTSSFQKETTPKTPVNSTPKLILSRQFQAPNKTIVIQRFPQSVPLIRPSLQPRLVPPANLPSNHFSSKILENKPVPILEKLQENASLAKNNFNLITSQSILRNQVTTNQASNRPIFIPSYSNGFFQIVDRSKQQNLSPLKTTPSSTPVNFLLLKNPSIMGQNLFLPTSSQKTNVILMSNPHRPATNLRPSYVVVPNNNNNNNTPNFVTSNLTTTLSSASQQQHRFAKVIAHIPNSVGQNINVASILRPPVQPVQPLQPLQQAPLNTVPILEKLAMQLESQNNRPAVPLTFKLSSTSNLRLSNPPGTITIPRNVTWTLANTSVSPVTQSRPGTTPTRLIFNQNLCYNPTSQIGSITIPRNMLTWTITGKPTSSSTPTRFNM